MVQWQVGIVQMNWIHWMAWVRQEYSSSSISKSILYLNPFDMDYHIVFI
jgi:hypothetical protein